MAHLRNIVRDLIPSVRFAITFTYARLIRKGRKAPGFFSSRAPTTGTCSTTTASISRTGRAGSNSPTSATHSACAKSGRICTFF